MQRSPHRRVWGFSCWWGRDQGHRINIDGYVRS